MKKAGKRLFTGIAVILLLTMVAACGDGGDKTTQTSTTEPQKVSNGETSESKSLPLKEADLLGLEPTTPNKKYRLAVATPHVRDHYYVGVVYGAIDEAQRWGAEVVRVVEAGGYANLNKQINQLYDLSELDVDAIIVGPIDYQATASVIDDIAKKGIKVITTANTSATESVSIAVMYDDYEYGKQAADTLAQLLGKKGNVVALIGPAGASWSNARTQGFKDQLKNYPDIKLLAEKHTDVDRLQAQKTMEDWLQRYGDKINGVYTALNLLAEGVVVASEGYGLDGKIKIVTSASSPETLQMLKDNKIHWVSSELGVITGRWAVQYSFKVLNGEKLSLPPAPKTLPSPPSNIVLLPKVTYTPDVDMRLPYKIDWAPEGWSIPK